MKTLKSLKVAADPAMVDVAVELRRQIHPYHKSRYIVTEDCELRADRRDDTPADESGVIADGGSIIAKMTDCAAQKDYARILSAAPESYKAMCLFRDFLNSLPKGWLGKTVGDIGLLNDAYILESKVTRKVEGK